MPAFVRRPDSLQGDREEEKDFLCKSNSEKTKHGQMLGREANFAIWVWFQRNFISKKLDLCDVAFRRNATCATIIVGSNKQPRPPPARECAPAVKAPRGEAWRSKPAALAGAR